MYGCVCIYDVMCLVYVWYMHAEYMDTRVRTEQGFRLLLPLSALLPGNSLSLNQKYAILTRLLGQQALETYLSLSSNAEVTGTCSQPCWVFHMGAGDLNSGPYVCRASALTSYLRSRLKTVIFSNL